MPRDYIPQNDEEFDEFAANFLNWLNFNFAAVGLTGAELADLQSSFADWTIKFPAFKASRVAYRAATSDKDDVRDMVESAIRKLAQRVQTFSGTSDAERQALRITVPGANQGAPPPPQDIPRPLASVRQFERLRHILEWVNSANMKKARPEGVFGTQIWVLVGPTPPTSLEGMRLLGIDTASPYVSEFDEADIGKTAHYILRYSMNADGSAGTGPLSETVSATITG